MPKSAATVVAVVVDATVAFIAEVFTPTGIRATNDGDDNADAAVVLAFVGVIVVIVAVDIVGKAPPPPPLLHEKDKDGSDIDDDEEDDKPFCCCSISRVPSTKSKYLTEVRLSLWSWVYRSDMVEKPRRNISRQLLSASILPIVRSP